MHHSPRCKCERISDKMALISSDFGPIGGAAGECRAASERSGRHRQAPPRRRPAQRQMGARARQPATSCWGRCVLGCGRGLLTARRADSSTSATSGAGTPAATSRSTAARSGPVYTACRGTWTRVTIKQIDTLGTAKMRLAWWMYATHRRAVASFLQPSPRTFNFSRDNAVCSSKDS